MNHSKIDVKGRETLSPLYDYTKGVNLLSCKLIRGGFSFCGVDIADIGLSYAPEKENTYVYRPGETNVHEETFDGHNGGYFYGITKQPKEFILRCYFENEAIDQGIMERIYHLFRIGKQGKLIFCRRPYCYYYATVTNSPAPELSNYLNGMITITMKAYYPFARSDTMYYDSTESKDPDNNLKVFENDFILDSTAFVENENMITQTSFANINIQAPDVYPVILHNPGTEYAPLSITISGDVGKGIVIRNKTTKQECKIIAVDKAHTTASEKYVYIDGISGSTSLIGQSESKPAFIYHDSGFIDLAPAYPVIRGVYVETSSTNIVTLVNTLYQDVTGQYIYLNGWHKIEKQLDEHCLLMGESVSTTSVGRTMISHMNELEIIPIDEADITHLSFSYKPTFA